MYYLFLDESGDHNYIKLDKDPVFVLAGCIFSNSLTYLNYLDAIVKIHNLKIKYFDNFYINLHTKDIIRNKIPFEKIKEKSFRDSFFDDCNRLLEETEFCLISTVVNKKELIEKYDSRAADPYFYSFDRLIERFIYFLDSASDKREGIIFYEGRRSDLDRKLENRFQNIKNNGVINIDNSINVSADRIQKRIIKIVKLTKESNTAGIEFADLCASPILRKEQGNKDNFIKYNIVENKFRKVDGKIEGCGLIVVK